MQRPEEAGKVACTNEVISLQQATHILSEQKHRKSLKLHVQKQPSKLPNQRSMLPLPKHNSTAER